MSCWMSSSRVQIDLDRSVDLPGDAHGLGDVVHLQPPAEAAAEELIVDHDLVERQPGDLRGGGLGAAQDLRAGPHLAAVGADMHGAVQGLHGGVCKQWHVVDGIDCLDGGTRRGRDVALLSGTTPCCFAACSSCDTRSAVASVALSPSSQVMLNASRPFLAAPMWSATTATASSRRTTCLTPSPPGPRRRPPLRACRRTPGTRRRSRSSCPAA